MATDLYRNIQPIPPLVFKPRPKVIRDADELEESMRSHLDFNALSDDQKQVFEATMRWFEHDADHGSVLTLGGYAGTGKSTLISILTREIENAGSGGHIRIAFCAYTGKAASVLKQKLLREGIEAGADEYSRHFVGTIHSLIYQPVMSQGTVVDWKLRERETLEDYDLVVIDEASMVDEKMLEDLKSYDLPILAVGDHGQLPPVKGLGTLMVDPDLRLERIHRQAEGNPIIQISKYIRENGRFPDDWKNDNHVRFCTFDEMFGVLEPLYETEDVNDIAILTYKNSTRQKMNYQARCMRHKKHMDPKPVQGDQFICLRNVRRTLFNGVRGILETPPSLHQSHWYEGRFHFPDDDLEVRGHFLATQVGMEKTFTDLIELNSRMGTSFSSLNQFGMFLDYGYALTVHKSQGSQFKHVVLVYERPYAVDDEDFARWLYTAATRARETLTIVVG